MTTESIPKASTSKHVFDGIDVTSARYSKTLPCPGTPLPDRFDSLPLLTRDQISSRIAAGQLLVLHPPLVYKIPSPWLQAHPGGDTAILHFVGRDATNEIEAYHSGSTVAQRMSRWIVGRIEWPTTNPILDADGKVFQGWRDMVPPIQLGKWPLPVPKIMVSRPTEPNETPLSAQEILKAATTASSSPIIRRKQSTPHPNTLQASEIDPTIDLAPDQLPLTLAYQHHLRQSLRSLHARIHALGLDTPPPFLSGYGPSLVIYLSLALLFGTLYYRATTTLGYLASSVALGLFWHQVTFVAHDAGHTGLTGHWFGDRVRGILIANFMGGMSLGWWCDNHNVHHLVTNSPEHDPDIQHLPFFAISTRFFTSLRSSYYKRAMEFDAFARTVLPHQHKLYYFIMLFARANLFVLSYTFMLTKWPSRSSPLFKLRLLEILGIAFFWTWFGSLLRHLPTTTCRILYVLVSFAVTSPLHVQIVLSHFSQPISIFPSRSPSTQPTTPSIASDDDEKVKDQSSSGSLVSSTALESLTNDQISGLELLESHAHRQLRTTMDIACPRSLDFLHGGLNFQTPHHLFPRIPRFHFRRVAQEIAAWVEKEQALVQSGFWHGERLKKGEGLKYKKMTFVQGNRDVLGVLKSVAQQVELLVQVAEKEAKGESHHH